MDLPAKFGDSSSLGSEKEKINSLIHLIFSGSSLNGPTDQHTKFGDPKMMGSRANKKGN